MFRNQNYKEFYINSNSRNIELKRKLKRKEKENRELIEYARKLRKERQERQEYCYLC